MQLNLFLLLDLKFAIREAMTVLGIVHYKWDCQISWQYESLVGKFALFTLQPGILWTEVERLFVKSTFPYLNSFSFVESVWNIMTTMSSWFDSFEQTQLISTIYHWNEIVSCHWITLNLQDRFKWNSTLCWGDLFSGVTYANCCLQRFPAFQDNGRLHVVIVIVPENWYVFNS